MSKATASRLAESLAILGDLADRVSAADSLELLAVTNPPGQEAEAASTWGSVAAFRDRFELERPSEARDIVESAIEACRAELGEERFQEAWSRGSALPLDEAIKLALAEERASRPGV